MASSRARLSSQARHLEAGAGFRRTTASGASLVPQAVHPGLFAHSCRMPCRTACLTRRTSSTCEGVPWPGVGRPPDWAPLIAGGSTARQAVAVHSVALRADDARFWQPLTEIGSSREKFSVALWRGRRLGFDARHDETAEKTFFLGFVQTASHGNANPTGARRREWTTA